MFVSKNSVPFILAGAVLFNVIFWQEDLALNAALFDAFIIGAILYCYPQAINNRPVRWILALHVIFLFALLWHHTLLGKLAWCGTLLLFIGFAQYVHRSVWFAGGAASLNFLLFIPGFLSNIRTASGVHKKSSSGKFVRFAVFPLLLLIVFFIVYNLANGVLAKWTSGIGDRLDKFLLKFFEWFSPERLVFLCFGFYVTGSLLLRSKVKWLEKREAVLSNELVRQRGPRLNANKGLWQEVTEGIMGKLAKGMVALKNENTVGIISLVLLNGLLMVVNFIDINHLWINFTYSADVNLFAMIHEGTELLIFSIVMAMLVLLFFFRGNLNFYQKNKWLKAGAYAWIIQNMVLVVSVFIRDYHYIVQFGLAYKRIGVLFFLAMVLVGLVTVFIKIHYKKTRYFLWKVNAWAGIVLLALGSMVNWDDYITRYNIAHRNTAPLNLPYLLEFSDNALAALDTNRAVLREREKELNKQNIKLQRCEACIDLILDNRKKRFIEEQQPYTWLSWNYADSKTKTQVGFSTASPASKQ